jgi:hypothetical protein
MDSSREVIRFSERFFDLMFGRRVYEGEVFLCGGVFKRLAMQDSRPADLDLWVRNRREREQLRIELEHRGATLERDFRPYCVKFKMQGMPVEINYQNVNDRGIEVVLRGFDLGVCSVAVRYDSGRVADCHVSEEFRRSLRDRCVYLMHDLLPNLEATHAPTILRTIDRMRRAAAELGFDPCSDQERRLWELFDSYSAAEKRQALNTYMETMVGYKGQWNAQVLRAATAAVTRFREECALALPA